MKRSIILSALLIATVGLTSCGRKKAQVDKDKPTGDAFALTADSTCAQVKKAHAGGKHSSKLFVGKNNGTFADEKVSAFATEVYKATMGDDASDEKLKVALSKIEIKDAKIAKGKKKLPEFIYAKLGENAEEVFEMFIVEGTSKDGKKTYKPFNTAFNKQTDCVEVKEPKPEVPRTLEVVKAELAKAEKSLPTEDKLKEAQAAKADLDKLTKGLTDAAVDAKAVLDKAPDADKKAAQTALDAANKAIKDHSDKIAPHAKVINDHASITKEIAKLKKEIAGLEKPATENDSTEKSVEDCEDGSKACGNN